METPGNLSVGCERAKREGVHDEPEDDGRMRFRICFALVSHGVACTGAGAGGRERVRIGVARR